MFNFDPTAVLHSEVLVVEGYMTGEHSGSEGVLVTRISAWLVLVYRWSLQIQM